jgi:protein ImuA
LMFIFPRSSGQAPPRRRPEVLEELRERLRGIGGGFALQSAAQRAVSTGFIALDRLLPGGGLRPGTLVEWVADSGAATLALAVAAHLVREDGAVVVIDEKGDFYPVAAAQLAIPLERTIVVRPGTAALWAWEQSLRCTGVAVTFGRIGTIDARVFRRLQLAVEAGGGLGFLLRKAESQAQPSWAATRIRVRSHAEAQRRGEEGSSSAPPRLCVRPLLVQVGRGQGGTREAEIEVRLINEPDHVSLVPPLADPVAERDAAGR